MSIYQTPEQYYIRLHHPRPRFKSNLESVLFFMSSEIARIGSETIIEKNRFNEALSHAIRMFPGNLNRSKKTINNWRTEIDALLGLIHYNEDKAYPSKLAKDLADNQDLVKFFKIFTYRFQYPSGALKPHVIKELLKHDVHFRPGPYIIQLLKAAEDQENSRIGIDKAELTHCVFNDLRVVRDQRNPLDTWQLIKQNRSLSYDYDWTGDVIRYAGDILDYMVQARLLKKQLNGKFYLNHNEDLAIQRFINPDEDFNGYRELNYYNLDDIKNMADDWVHYMNKDVSYDYFETDVLSLYTDDQVDKYNDLKKELEGLLESEETQKIGSVGEALVINHEQIYLKLNDRADLKHLVQLIPAKFGVGYDVLSRELDAKHKNIEVKTTASPSERIFERFHLTPNEWEAAKSHNERYYVYRLLVSPKKIKLHILPNPIYLFKDGKLDISVRNGVDVTFSPKECGYETELLVSE